MKNKIICFLVCLIMVLAIFAIIPPVSASDLPGAAIPGITFYQIDFVFDNAKYINSDTGKIEIDIPTLKTATRLDAGFINGYTAQGWVIRNLHFQKDYPYNTKSTYFNLGTTTDAKVIKIYIEVTSNLKTRFTGSIMTQYPVLTTVNSAEGDGYLATSAKFKAIDLGPIGFLQGGPTYNYTQPNHHPENNVQAACSQCVPMAYANNLQYLEDTFSIDIPDQHIMGFGNWFDNYKEPDESLVAELDIKMQRASVVDRQSGGGTWVINATNGMLEYIYLNSLPITVKHQSRLGDDDLYYYGGYFYGMGEDIDWDWVIDSVKNGYAVGMRYRRYKGGVVDSGHMVSIMTAGYIGGVPYVEFVHDAKQACVDLNDNKGLEIRESLLGVNSTDGNYTLLACPAPDGFAEIVRITVMEVDNAPPSIPEFISGPMDVDSDTINQYTFESTDPEGNDVFYKIDWGDGEVTDWYGPFASGDPKTFSHSWSETGIYPVQVRARDYYLKSAWSLPFWIAVDIDVIDIELENVLQLDLLPNINGFNNKIDNDIAQSAKHIQVSLENELWVDGRHIDSKHGHKVFSEHKSAVQKLQELLLHKNLPEDVQEDCLNAIGKLTLMDGLLAMTAFEDAQTSGRMTKQTQHQLDLAEEQLNDGINNCLSGDGSKAIDDFRQSWQHSQNVM